MKLLQLLLSTGLLLGALLPCCPEARVLSRSPVPEEEDEDEEEQSLAPQPSQPQQPGPLVLRLGEDYFLRLGSLARRKSPDAAFASDSSSQYAASASGGHFFRAALQQQQQQHPLPQAQPLRGRALGGAGGAALSVGPGWEGGPQRPQEQEQEEEGALVAAAAASMKEKKEKRSEEPPISLDLTFHLLREVLEMARAEQLAQQAHSNRKLMEIIGK